jgi:hypothetical protein
MSQSILETIANNSSNQQLNDVSEINKFKWLNFTFIQIAERICKVS